MALVYLENSYLENADNYLTDFPDWEAATAEAQEQALIDATTLLDQKQWLGYAVSEAQPLAWPRVADSFFDPVLNLQVSFETGEIPIRLQKATAQLALHLIRYPEVITDAYGQKFDSITVGPISLESGGSSRNKPRKTPSVPVSVNVLIEPLLFKGNVSSNSWWRSN